MAILLTKKQRLGLNPLFIKVLIPPIQERIDDWGISSESQSFIHQGTYSAPG